MKFDDVYKAILEKKENKLEDFLDKRKAGAAKIEKSARAKGGLSLLTAAHFKAKARTYNEAIKETNGKVLTHCKDKTLELLKQLEDIDNISQNDWQKLTGELEAYGEAYIQSLKFNK